MKITRARTKIKSRGKKQNDISYILHHSDNDNFVIAGTPVAIGLRDNRNNNSDNSKHKRIIVINQEEVTMKYFAVPGMAMEVQLDRTCAHLGKLMIDEAFDCSLIFYTNIYESEHITFAN